MMTSYTILYMMYAVQFILVPLPAAAAKRRSFKVAAPLRLDSVTQAHCISLASSTGKHPPIAPHPDVDLEKAAACSLFSLE